MLLLLWPIRHLLPFILWKGIIRVVEELETNFAVFAEFSPRRHENRVRKKWKATSRVNSALPIRRANIPGLLISPQRAPISNENCNDRRNWDLSQKFYSPLQNQFNTNFSSVELTSNVTNFKRKSE